MTPILAFDIETVPDIAGLRRLHDLPDGTPDGDVAEMAFHARRISSGTDFLPLHLHRVVAISCALRDGDTFRVWSLGEPEESEAHLVQRFFDGVERYTPQLVSWNGGGFDLPVLHYRALMHGMVARRYWDQGEDDRDFKWNSYLGRYHARHLDLMDVLAMYQPRASAPLDDLARLMGLPGKLGLDGSKVWGAYLDGGLPAIRSYCETDAVNTYLVFLRFQLMRGHFDADQFARESQLVRDTLGHTPGDHWREFLHRWAP